MDNVFFSLGISLSFVIACGSSDSHPTWSPQQGRETQRAGSEGGRRAQNSIKGAWQCTASTIHISKLPCGGTAKSSSMPGTTERREAAAPKVHVSKFLSLGSML